MRTPITFALGVAAGAAGARLLATKRSHDVAASRAQSTASSAASSVQSTATHAAQQAKGAAHAAMPSRSEPLDDVSLAHKVESEIFRPVDAPKGDVSVDVQAGVATLRGEVPEPWIEKLGDEAGHVDGVQGVQNLLHAPGTPGARRGAARLGVRTPASLSFFGRLAQPRDGVADQAADVHLADADALADLGLCEVLREPSRRTSRSRSLSTRISRSHRRARLGLAEAGILDADGAAQRVGVLLVVARAVERDGAVGGGRLARLEDQLGRRVQALGELRDRRRAAELALQRVGRRARA